MATFTCRIQYLDDTDPFSSTNFPEPTRPPTFTFHLTVPLINQIGGVHRLLEAPHKVSNGTEQVSEQVAECKQTYKVSNSPDIWRKYLFLFYSIVSGIYVFNVNIVGNNG